ncbi:MULTISPECIES: hypothetical protein [unclassified Sphingomonas]|jgi:hypothetical protein|uniref:hypothetical protein n=1 Tax=unclassified Sphingomonas TaxID=196159 RepID=UPI0025811171|nr:MULTISPECIES: hypothetical protein [unclassified Sphingomonas]
MARLQMQVETAHPILFLADAAPVVSIPPDTGASFVTATHDCLAFWVLASVDGASLVTVSDEACEAGGAPLFDGTIDAPSGIVTLMDSSTFRYLNVPVFSGRLSVRVWAEDDQNPEWVWLQLGTIRQI